MAILVKVHRQGSKNPLLVCDNCDARKDKGQIYDVYCDTKSSHKLLLCDVCVPDEWRISIKEDD
jgi:hypothetical protein